MNPAMTRAIAVCAAAAGALLLAGCGPRPNQAPSDEHVCYQVVEQPGGKLRFNAINKNSDRLESCVAELDAARYRFMRLGSKHDYIGAYGGKFMFIDDAGMRLSMNSDFDGPRFQAFSRGPDGRLSIPSYIPQPGPAEAGSQPEPASNDKAAAK